MIKMENVKKSYQVGTVEYPALKNITLNVDEGELLGILGKSGSGKTTLLNIISALDSMDSGKYLFRDEDVSEYTEDRRAQFRNEHVGIVLQDYSLINHKTVLFNAMLPMYFGRTPYREMKDKAMEALAMAHVEELAEKKANELSGGQRQRVAIARALVNDTDLILADEPTGALDSETTKDIMALFQSLNEKGKTIIIVTHDDYVASCCKRIVRIKDGEVVD